MTPRHRPRGFSLVELLTVVAVVGILAVVGVMTVRNHLRAAKVTEAFSVIQGVRAAQERYRSENRQYANVSGTLINYYPATSDGIRRGFFRTLPPTAPSDTLDAAWRRLGPVVPGPVYFGYAVQAGPGNNENYPTPSTASAPGWTTATSPWFVVQAEADLDNDGSKCWVVASSLNNAVYTEGEGN